MTLFTYYKRHGVQYRKTDLASVNKLAKAATIQREQLELVDWVDQVEAAGGKQLFYLDETSVHCWLTKRACWRDAGQRIKLPLQATRGRSATIIACLGGRPVRFIYKVCDRTNTFNVLLFLNHFIQELEDQDVDLTQVVVVTDNASSHRSRAVREFFRPVRCSSSSYPATHRRFLRSNACGVS